MKKLLAILLCAALALSMSACMWIIKGGTVTPLDTPEATDGTGAQIPNPMEPVSGAAAFEDIGITMDAPEGAEDISYFIISNELAQVNFTLSGFEYTYRASKTQTDISGVYDTFAEAFSVDCDADGAVLTVTAQNASSGGRLATWSANGVNYSLWCALAPDDAALKACALGAMKKTFASVTETVSEAAAPVDFTEAGVLDMDLNGDGALEHVSFESHYDDQNYVTFTTMHVVSDDGNEASADLELLCGLSAGFACDIDNDGLVELFLSGDVCSCDYNMWLLRYDDGAITSADPCFIPDYEYNYILPAAYGSINKIENGVITMSDTVDILGSWWCQTQYRMTSAGFGMERVPGSVWSFDSSDYTAQDWDWSMITSALVPVTLDGQTSPTTLPVGTRLIPIDTDGETYVHFITEDGTKGTIYVTFNSDSWGYSIDGIDEYDLFENLPYAG
ncbi:MAG TPA: hypothetical protein VN540_09745 [Clostridia bacterium]|nr:hypothetical protein [Clostridia bacterium]